MTNKMISAAISAVIAMGLNNAFAADTDMGKVAGMEKCYGIAKAGKNDCGSAKNTCAGEAKQDGQKDAWINVPTGLCNRIVGGSLKAPEEK